MATAEEIHSECTWPARFRELERNYDQFYTTKPSSAGVFCLYAGCNGELQSVRETRITLETDGVLSESEVRRVAARRARVGGASYTLASGGLFTVSVQPQDMEEFVATDWQPESWTPLDVKTPPSISLPETVHALGQETSLVLLFRRRKADKRHTARRAPGREKGRDTRRNRKGLKTEPPGHAT